MIRKVLVALTLFVASATLTPASAQADQAQAAAAAPIKDLDTLLARCAKMPGLYAKFTEEKQIALLAVPLKSEGTVHFARTRGLARHTTAPSPSSVLVTDKELIFWDGKTTKKVGLASSATLEAFARSFSMLLAADRAALEKTFTLTLTPKDGGNWSLELVPKNDLKKVIASMTIEGRDLELTTLKVKEANGDVSTSRFTQVDVAKSYSNEEADRVFRAPPLP